MIARLQVVDQDYWTERQMIAAEVGRASCFARAAFTAKGVAPAAQLAAALTVMQDHADRLTARRPGWVAVARDAGWLP